MLETAKNLLSTLCWVLRNYVLPKDLNFKLQSNFKVPFSHEEDKMANVLQFGMLRSGVLKRINEVFPDRESQWRELGRIARMNETQQVFGPPSIAEAKILVTILEILIGLQRQTVPPSSVNEVKEVMERTNSVLKETPFNSISKPVIELIHSISTQISAYCAVFLVFILHLFIYSNTAICTSQSDVDRRFYRFS